MRLNCGCICVYVRGNLRGGNNKQRDFNLLTVFSVSLVVAPAWICCSESCECFKLSCHTFHWKFFFFFSLAGWSCHERMMSVTNNKTDMFTEEPGLFSASILIFAGSKSAKIWCKAPIASSEKYWLYRGCCSEEKQQNKNTTNEAQSAPGLSCVGLHPVLPLTGCRALTPSFLSGQCRPHIWHMLTYILNLVTVWPWTPTGCAVRSNQHGLELYF